MKIMEIEGGRELSGTIRISGAKNATVALIPAAILSDEEVTICNIPEITDTTALCDILKVLLLILGICKTLKLKKNIQKN